MAYGSGGGFGFASAWTWILVLFVLLAIVAAAGFGWGHSGYGYYLSKEIRFLGCFMGSGGEGVGYRDRLKKPAFFWLMQ